MGEPRTGTPRGRERAAAPDGDHASEAPTRPPGTAEDGWTPRGRSLLGSLAQR